MSNFSEDQEIKALRNARNAPGPCFWACMSETASCDPSRRSQASTRDLVALRPGACGERYPRGAEVISEVIYPDADTDEVLQEHTYWANGNANEYHSWSIEAGYHIEVISLPSKTIPQSAHDTNENSAEIRRPSLPESAEDESSIDLPPQSVFDEFAKSEEANQKRSLSRSQPTQEEAKARAKSPRPKARQEGKTRKQAFWRNGARRRSVGF